MGKYFDLNEFKKLLGEEKDKRAEKGASIEYKDAQIKKIHEHLFGDDKNDKLIYSTPAYFIDAAQDITEKTFSEFHPKIIKDRKIYDGDELLTTPPSKMRDKEYIFVLTQNNELLIEEANLNRGKDRRFNHSLLAGHKPVKMAGTITVQEGVIKTITNESGHFMPSKDNFIQFLKEYVNNEKLTLCRNFKAKYLVSISHIVGDTELKDISSEEIASLLAGCPREKIALPRPPGFAGAKRGLLGISDVRPAAGGFFASLTQPNNHGDTGTRKRSFSELIEDGRDHDVGSSTRNFMSLLAGAPSLPITPQDSPPR